MLYSREVMQLQVEREREMEALVTALSFQIPRKYIKNG
jgi:hypothetical protein